MCYTDGHCLDLSGYIVVNAKNSQNMTFFLHSDWVLAYFLHCDWSVIHPFVTILFAQTLMQFVQKFLQSTKK